MHSRLVPGIFALLLASCAPATTTTYHWEYTKADREPSSEDFRREDVYCQGYASQSSRPSQSQSSTTPSGTGGSGASGLYSAIGNATSNYYAQLAAQDHMRSLYLGCMAALGWELVPDQRP